MGPTESFGYPVVKLFDMEHFVFAEMDYSGVQLFCQFIGFQGGIKVTILSISTTF